MTAASRPNVVLIMSDEHDPATMGCYGDRLGTTPNLDALAARGVLFENAYTPCPLCQPARLAFTGVRYPSRIGAWTNSCRLPRDGVPSLADAINAAGYRSLLCGKMHFPAGERYGFEELFPCRGNSPPATGRGGRRDPGEFRNLTIDPAFAPLLSELHAALVREIGEDPEETEARCRADLARGYQAA